MKLQKSIATAVLVTPQYSDLLFSGLSAKVKSAFRFIDTDKACAAVVPTPPSTDDIGLYPDVNTFPTYNYLGIDN